uniref:EH domain-containing protein n=1 Tax=Panagrolaimus sp. ES5 TaxID=591445 RepID=A0AC34GRA4_9BILA
MCTIRVVNRGGGGVVPPTLLEEKRIPKFYKDCLASCGAINASQLPNTALVYNLMIASQLSHDALSDIWTMVNRTIPGQLTRSEFFSCLALIALAQKNENISALCNVTTLPIPHLQTFTEVTKVPSKHNSMNSKAVIETSDLRMKTKVSSVQSSKKEMRDNMVEFEGKKNSLKNNNFVPTNLVNSKSHASEKREESNETILVDLISDFCDNDQFSKTEIDQKQEPSKYDFLDIDLTLPAENSRESTPKLAPHEYDPYADLRVGPPEDEHLDTWQRILSEGIKILNDSINLLENSPSLTEEISQTETGIEFIQSIRAIADVLNRVALSLFKHRPNEKQIVDDARKSLLLWKEFIKKSYIFKALEDIDNDSTYNLNEISGFASTLYPKEQTFCGICIHQITFDDPAFLQFAGYNYHSPCANFWANIVDISLPKLEKL